MCSGFRSWCRLPLEVLELVLDLAPVGFVRRRVFHLGNHRPGRGQLCVELEEMLLFLGQLVFREDRLDRTLRLAQGAVDAFLGIYNQHVRTLVKTVDRANLDTVGQFALDATLGNDKGHRGGPGGSMGS